MEIFFKKFKKGGWWWLCFGYYAILDSSFDFEVMLGHCNFSVGPGILLLSKSSKDNILMMIAAMICSKHQEFVLV